MSIFTKIFSKFLQTGPGQKAYQNFKFMNAWSPTFSSVGENIYKSQVTRSAIHSIANNAAKFHPHHMRKIGMDIKEPTNSRLQYLLSVRPNEMLSAFDFYYKLVTTTENKNNAFVFIDRGINGEVVRFIPIDYQTVEAIESERILFLKFLLNGGDTLVLPYADVIHTRKFLYEKPLFGEDNSALLPTLQLIQTVNDGVSNAVESSASLRGILTANGVVKEDDMIAAKNRFVEDYLNPSNNGGVAMLDSKMDFKSIDSKPVLIDSEQMNAIKNEVYDYFGTNDDIVQNKYNEDTWNAFYESKLEPYATQMSQEFTYKIFTKTEQGHGNIILFESNKLAYASNKTKIQLVKEVGALGALTINEIRTIFNMSPVEGGEKRLQTLNVVNADKADQYQEIEEENDEA